MNESTMLLTLLLKGMIIGLAASIPLGPIGVICIQRTINKGRISGFLSGLGAATTDTFFAAIAGFSLSFIISFLEARQTIIELVGGAIVVFLGIKIFTTNPISQIKRNKRKKNNLLEDFMSVLLLTGSNPLAVFLFIALFATAGVISHNQSLWVNLIALAGVFLGAALWWFILTSTVSYFRKHFRLKQLWWINKISGAAIFTLGGLAITNVIYKIFF